MRGETIGANRDPAANTDSDTVAASVQSVLLPQTLVPAWDLFGKEARPFEVKNTTERQPPMTDK